MVNVLESEPVKALRYKSDAASVKRSVNELEFRMTLAGVRCKHKRENVVQILFIHILAHQLDFTTLLVRCEPYLCRVGNLGDFCHNVLVHRRSNLCTV